MSVVISIAGISDRYELNESVNEHKQNKKQIKNLYYWHWDVCARIFIYGVGISRSAIVLCEK